MRRSTIALAVLIVLLSSALGSPASASTSAVDDVDAATLEARIEWAQRRVERWYERIERWYARIDRAAIHVQRLEEMVEAGDVSASVLRRTMPRGQDPEFLLATANEELREVLTDPWARHVQSELDAWNAFLSELVRTREGAMRPAIDGARDRDRPDDRGETTRPGPDRPVTYEVWARAFLRHLGAPACDENLLVVVTWETAESTVAAFNPLATTRDMPKATDMNSVGVKHYVSLGQGLDASRDTLLRGAESYLYGAIVDSVRACASAEATARAINASAWCRGCVGGAYITGLLPIVRNSYDEHALRLVSAAA